MAETSQGLSDRGTLGTFAAASQRPFQYRGALKRGVDVFLSLILFPALGPIILLLFLLVRWDGGTGFFAHTRRGRNGRVFRCWKIRTMVPNAEQKLKSVLRQNADLQREWVAYQKLKHDPRVTAFGRVLRKTGLDELPQIWNVLRGDMSLIGPRPVTQSEIKRYGPDSNCYDALRPGVTGLWQVSGRNDVSYQDRVTLDRIYSENLSLGLDLMILLKTIGALFRRTGY